MDSLIMGAKKSKPGRMPAPNDGTIGNTIIKRWDQNHTDALMRSKDD